MGAIARESSRGWMTFSILWGLNIAYSLSTLYYQTVSFRASALQPGVYSGGGVVQRVSWSAASGAQPRDVSLLATPQNAATCCQSPAGDCH
jgi:ferrous iron transport protein B